MASTAQDPHAPLRAAAAGEKAKDEDLEDVEFSPFYGIEKGAVLQEARIFHGPNLDPRRCQQVITKLLYLLNQGEAFTKKEATEVFFAATKLFQNKDMNLRRMVYLCLRDICPGSDEVIIVTSSLMKDMNSKVDLYRSNAIRVLRTIIDSGLLVQIERYFKQAIVDKEPVVASAALVAGMHLLKVNADVVKRWSSEIQEAVNNKSAMVQFHAIALLAGIKATDRLAISKLVSSLTKGSTRSPLATCLLIKYISVVLKDTSPSADGTTSRPFYDFLLASLRHKSEMVMFQAARAIAEMKDVNMRELAPAITVLQLFLSSSKPVLRFTAVRTLNKVSMTHPMAVASCNIEMEQLMTDTNRSIATYAITTLLKTGSESSVERLLKQIGNFMSDIADDFKIVVVEAIRSLCQKFPAKHRILMNFLAHTLREEGGFEYKKAIVDAILFLIHDIEAAKETGLLHLSEFIEDCEFTYLATQVLHVLGTEGPKASDPARFIRFIYNRIILENATVRAAAVSALAAFGAQCDGLRERIVTLLRRTLQDNDDEVRDRSTLYIKQLTGDGTGTDVIMHKFDVPLLNLEKALNEYLAGPMTAPFSIDAVDRDVEEPDVPVKKGKKAAESLVAQKAVPTEDEEFGKSVEAMPQFASLGPRFKSCKRVALTEEDLEYTVICIKHVFAKHVLLQFNCTNTIPNEMLENVSMEVDLSGLEELAVAEGMVLPLKRMPHNAAGSTYVALEKAEDAAPTGTAMVVMKFTTKEVDPTSGLAEDEGYEDEYQLEDLSFDSSDYIKARHISNFKTAWDEMSEDTEVADDYGLGVVDGISGTVESIMDHLGMACCEGTDVVAPNARSHTIMLSGEFCGGRAVLVKISFGLDAKSELAMKVVTRGDSKDVSAALHGIIQDA